MAKVVCVLYDDPVDGYPTSYARDDLPKIDHYPGGQTLPTPKAVDFQPGGLLGSVSGELGLRKFLEIQGHTLVVPRHEPGYQQLEMFVYLSDVTPDMGATRVVSRGSAGGPTLPGRDRAPSSVETMNVSSTLP